MAIFQFFKMAYWLCYCSDIAERKPAKLYTMFGRLWAGILYIHFPGLLPHNGGLFGAKFTLCPSLALCYVGSVTAWYSSSGRQPNFVALRRGHHLCSAGRLSRWALAHILVLKLFCYLLKSDSGKNGYFQSFSFCRRRCFWFFFILNVAQWSVFLFRFLLRCVNC